MRFSGKALARARGEMAQKELAALSGVSEFQISRLENGHNQPEASTIAALAVALGVPLEAFFEPNGTTGGQS